MLAGGTSVFRGGGRELLAGGTSVFGGGGRELLAGGGRWVLEGGGTRVPLSGGGGSARAAARLAKTSVEMTFSCILCCFCNIEHWGVWGLFE